MQSVNSAKDVIALWPTRPEMARDMNAEPGETVTVDRIHKWAQSGVIPATYHARILRAARVRGFNLSADDMVRVHDAGRDAA
jgi:hypothetical protein